MTAHSKGHLVRCIPQYKQETWRPKPVLVSSALVFLPSRSQFCVIVLLCDVLCFSVVRVPTQLGKQQDHSRSSSLTYYCYGLVPRVMSFWLYSCFRSMLRSQNLPVRIVAISADGARWLSTFDYWLPRCFHEDLQRAGRDLLYWTFCISVDADWCAYWASAHVGFSVSVLSVSVT